MQDKLSNGFSGNGKRTMNLKWTKKKKKLFCFLISEVHHTPLLCKGKLKKKNKKKFNLSYFSHITVLGYLR